MRHLLIATMTVTLTLPPMLAQKIENETASRERVVRVQTAMNHLTVIEVGEPVAIVAVGSPQSFKVERRENKVFIQPLVENVSTNLFIWTASTRLSYELVPAVGDAGQMDFAIDYRQQQPQAQVTQPKLSRAGCRGTRCTWRNAAEQHASSIGGLSGGAEGEFGRAHPGRLSPAGRGVYPLFNREPFESHVSHRPAECGVFERPAIRSVVVDVPKLAIGSKRRLSSESR